jgi:hypothetical protein
MTRQTWGAPPPDAMNVPRSHSPPGLHIPARKLASRLTVLGNVVDCDRHQAATAVPDET